MTLTDLLAEGRIRPHQTSQRELADLLRVVDRDLADARVAQISADRRFATAYNAALQLATIVLHADGYRAGYLDQCRSKRNVSDYDRAGEISDQGVSEILAETTAFRTDVLDWLANRHPSLLPDGAS